MQPHGLMFHHFHGGGHPPVQGSMSAQQLVQLLWFIGHDRILSAEEWLDRALNGTLRPRDVCLTFDDNLRCQYDVALPVLEEHGLTAFWFVPTSVVEGTLERLEIYRVFRTRCFETVEDFYGAFYRVLDQGELAAALADFEPAAYLAEFPFYSDSDRQFRFVRDEVLGPRRYDAAMDVLLAERGLSLEQLGHGLWMSGEQLCDLAESGHVVGLHSHTHPTRLGELDETAQESEYVENFRVLNNILPRPPVAMSHPCNSYSPATLEILHHLGIKLGFRANLAQPAHGPLEFPRADHANLIRKMSPCASPSSPVTSRATRR